MRSAEASKVTTSTAEGITPEVGTEMAGMGDYRRNAGTVTGPHTVMVNT